MKFKRQLFLSTATVASFMFTVHSSFVATAAKKVVFEVAVVGKLLSTDLIVTQYSNGTPGLLAVLKLHEQPIVQLRAFDLDRDPKLAGPNARGAHVKESATVQDFTPLFTCLLWIALASTSW